MKHVHGLLETKLLQNPDYQGLRNDLYKEILQDYQSSLCKATVDYILKDSAEMARLKIASIPRNFPQRIIRAPVPWHDSLSGAREAQMVQLFTTNTLMLELQQLWHNE